MSDPFAIAWRGMLAVVGALLLLPATSQAFTSSPVWKCRASALYTSIGGNNRVEPVVANGNPSTANNQSPDRAQCANEEAGADNLATPLGIGTDVVGAQSASAKTVIDPELGQALDQKVGATARVENLNLPLGGTTVILGVGAANVTATASCVNGAPVFDAVSSMADLTLGGVPISLNDLLAGLQSALSPLGVLIDVKFNEQIRENGSLIARAAHIKLLGANAATPLLDLVIAEAKIDTEQYTCDPDHQIPGFVGQICPTGSQYTPLTGVCIIPATATTPIIVVGKPFQGPSGGTVLPTSIAITKYGKKECLTRPGPKYAIIGTNKADRITGTNKDDRILGRGGNDSLDGGRGKDCIDGGSGNDRMNGGIGSDRLLGDVGGDTITGGLDKDSIAGGAGNDRLNGGSGIDTITSGKGNDIINLGYNGGTFDAGTGNDVVNIAVAGPPGHGTCGAGNDTIRMNGSERRRVKSCEKQYVLKDR